jgi:hypothetical protein
MSAGEIFLAVDPTNAEAFALQVEFFFDSMISSIVTESWVPKISIL